LQAFETESDHGYFSNKQRTALAPVPTHRQILPSYAWTRNAHMHTYLHTHVCCRLTRTRMRASVKEPPHSSPSCCIFLRLPRLLLPCCIGRRCWINPPRAPSPPPPHHSHYPHGDRPHSDHTHSGHPHSDHPLHQPPRTTTTVTTITIPRANDSPLPPCHGVLFACQLFVFFPQHGNVTDALLHRSDLQHSLRSHRLPSPDSLSSARVTPRSWVYSVRSSSSLPCALTRHAATAARAWSRSLRSLRL
jgi:hypothetical protein